jgi:small-conductance mechanosensitive channel
MSIGSSMDMCSRSPRLVDFIVGMVLYNVYRKLSGRKFNYGNVKVTIIELSVIALCAVVAPLCLIHGLIHYYRASVLWFLPIALLILVFTVFKVFWRTGNAVIVMSPVVFPR